MFRLHEPQRVSIYRFTSSARKHNSRLPCTISDLVPIELSQIDTNMPLERHLPSHKFSLFIVKSLSYLFQSLSEGSLIHERIKELVFKPRLCFDGIRIGFRGRFYFVL